MRNIKEIVQAAYSFNNLFKMWVDLDWVYKVKCYRSINKANVSSLENISVLTFVWDLILTSDT